MKIFLLICALISPLSAIAADSPNILWITSEDNDYGWLGCYGSAEAHTPRLDNLATHGILFKHAYSNAPVCAVARSTILNGSYAVTQGTQHMRSRHPISADYQPYTAYLRQAGYYCTNRTKTDYNFKGNDLSIWDECSRKAHYKKRPKGAPFFAVFNLTVSHESSLFEEKINNNRKWGLIPRKPRISPDKVTVRPYLPDLPEIRSDIATYHDTMTALDSQIGKILDELKKANVADDTIIFYYGDHGGITPRGKRYLKDSGTHIPMLVHVPEKWKALSPFKPGQKIDEPVAFVDLAPTLLSLVGTPKPKQMQGRAFLGAHRVEPTKDDMVFLYADRFDEIYGMRRGLTDGRWKYIRRFTPHLSAAPYSSYQFSQAGWRAWQQAWKDGKLKGRHHDIWENNQPIEELFDTHADPWEVHNLATNPTHAKRLADMRTRLKQKMVEVKDTGIIPEPMFAELAPKQPISSYWNKRVQEIPTLVELAFTATERNTQNLPSLIDKLNSQDPVTRYWAAQGILILGKSALRAKPAMTRLLTDKQSAIRVAAAQFLITIDLNEQGTSALIAELQRDNNEYAELNTINAIKQSHALAAIPDSWINAVMKNKNAGKYIKRIASQSRLAKGKGK
ncbi:MAG: sulfatase-like hydrolase/transferase [Verrucomicrobiae bacterium]|nr:sulfatase-like hydrolase/transferase [Verrucomicrobiae bacterium]NNJ44248.1 sulfatase-like hydrolase/transferase [Akkermansiaceae bacterium]